MIKDRMDDHINHQSSIIDHQRNAMQSTINGMGMGMKGQWDHGYKISTVYLSS